MTVMPTGHRSAALAAVLILLAVLFPPDAVKTARADSASDAAGFYEDALVRFNKLDYRGAIVQLRNVLQKDPNNLAARILLGRAHLRVGAAAAAEKELELARKAGADEELIFDALAKSYLLQRKFRELLDKISSGNREPVIEAQVLNARASANFELFQYETAMAEFERALILAPDRPGPLLGQAKILIRLGRFSDAAAKTDAAQKLDPKAHDVWALRGELHRIAGRLEEAVTAYGKTLVIAPGHIPARIGRATALIDLDRHGDAVPDLDHVLRIDHSDPQALYLRSLTHKKFGNTRRANTSLQRADQTIRNYDTEFLRSHPPTLLLAGVIANALEKPDDARFYLSEYIKMVPNHLGARHLLGSLLVKKNRAKKAIEVLEPILSVVPDDWQALALLGTAYTRLGKSKEATRMLQRAVEQMPDRPTLRTRLALSRLAIGQDSQAVKDLEKALQQSPDAVRPAMLLGLLHLRLRHFDQTIAVAKGMIERNAKNAAAFNLLGGAQLGSGARQAARISFEKAVELDSNFAPAQSNLAKLDIKEGNLKSAKRRYQEMLRADPQALDPMIALSSLAERAGDMNEAIRWLEKVGSFKRKDVNSQLQLINLYHRAGRLEAALVLAVRLKQEFASDLTVLAAVGKAELQTGSVDAAVKTFRRMSNMRPDSASHLLKISRLQTKAKDFEGAFNTLTRAVWVAPDNLAAQQEIVKLEIHLGRLDAARERVEELLLTMPGSGVGEWLRGDVMMARKNYPAAADDYQTSIDLTGGSSVLAIRLYKARFSAGQHDEAIKLLETWVGAHKGDFEAARTLAGAYISVRRLSKAIEVHEKMIADRPNDPKLLNNLAWLYQRTGDKRALSFAMRAYKNAPKDPSATDTLGWILVQRGQAAKGLKLLRQANARAARQPRIRFHMAVALKQLNRLDEAREEFKAVLLAAKKNDPELAREVQEQLDSLGK